jgi:hypothetical protein
MGEPVLKRGSNDYSKQIIREKALKSYQPGIAGTGG